MKSESEQERPNFVVIYHSVSARDNAEEALDCLVQVIKHAQEVQPDCRRILHMTINGHRKEDGSFNEMMTDFQLRMVPQRIVPYLSEALMPLGTYRNEKQSNDVPDHA